MKPSDLNRRLYLKHSQGTKKNLRFDSQGCFFFEQQNDAPVEVSYESAFEISKMFNFPSFKNC